MTNILALAFKGVKTLIKFRSISKLDREAKIKQLPNLTKKIYDNLGIDMALEEIRWNEILGQLKNISSAIVKYNKDDFSINFNPLRLGLKDLEFLIDRIHAIDCYGFNLVKNKNPVVIDAGGHIGTFPLSIMLKNSNSKVYVFEPDQENYKLLNINCAPFPNIKTFQSGLLDQSKTLDFFVSKKIDWRSTSIENKDFMERNNISEEELSEKYTIQTISVDEFVSEENIKSLDLLKITVPGELEPKVLEGAQHAIQKFKPLIVILIYDINLTPVRKFLADMKYVEIESPWKTPFNNKIYLFKSSE
jgi:FkbM family methyltransferase